MPFKKMRAAPKAPDSPRELLPLLPRRKFTDLLPHQEEILDGYASVAQAPDVAAELPTGSGKTLVGLLVGEWRRRKWGDRVVYLCPTRQLVHQTVAQASKIYGVPVVGFTGPKKERDPSAWSAFMTGDKIAVTTYSSLFNTAPAFADPDAIILDDAHAAENYVASMWSLEVPAGDTPMRPLHDAIVGLLRDRVAPMSYARLRGSLSSSADAT